MSESSASIRLASFDDSRSLNSLISVCGGSALLKAMFGQYTVLNILENSTIPIIAQSPIDKDIIVGFFALSDSVNINCDINYEEALQVIQMELNQPLQASNISFVNFFALDDRKKHSDQTSFNLIKEAFSRDIKLDFIAWALPKAAIISNSILMHFSELTFDSTNKLFANYNVLIAKRKNFLKTMYVREARIEDNDDIVPIMRARSKDSQLDVGDFFLADLISNNEGRSKFFVNTDGDRAMGFLSVSMDINLKLIQSIFDTKQFSELVQVERNVKPLILVKPALKMDLLLENLSMNLKSIVWIQIVDILDSKKMNLIVYENCSTRSETTTDLKVFISNLTLDKSILAVSIIVNEYISKAFYGALKEGLLFDYVVKVTISDMQIASSEIERKFTSKATLTQIVLPSNDDGWFNALEDKFSNILKYDTVNSKKETSRTNCFGVTMFCIHPSVDSKGCDLLKIAFEEFSDVDYGLFLTPCNEPPPSICDFMTQVPLQDGISFDQALYIFSRNSIVAENFSVDRITLADMNCLEVFLSKNVSSHLRDYIMKLCDSSSTFNNINCKDNPEEISFAVKLDGEIVSVINISRKSTSVEELVWLRSHFDVDKVVDLTRHRNRTQAMITSWFVNPFFSSWSKYILREVMRQYGKTLLFFMGNNVVWPTSSVLENMIQVNHRSQIEKSSSKQLLLPTKPLFMVSKYHIARPPVKRTNRLVVIGGSTSSIAFLEYLCLLQEISPMNITIVTNNIPRSIWKDSHDHDEIFIDYFSGCLSVKDTSDYSINELILLGLKYKVNFIEGRVTDIDRANHSIVLSNEVVLEYDYLVISTNPQDNSARNFPSVKGYHPNVLARKGIFGIGNYQADLDARSWILKKSDIHIIIYGHCLEAIHAASRIIKEGVNIKNIIIVTDDDIVTGFYCSSMNDIAAKIIGDSGLKIKFGSKIVDVEIDVDTIQSIYISSSTEENEKLGCNCLISCLEKLIDVDLHAAINACGIVYDGGIVVDENFRTVDPRIFAFSQNTKPSRSKIESHLHSRWNARELGKFAARKIARFCYEIDTNDKSADKFSLPNSSLSELPGGYYHFVSTSPTDFTEKEDYITSSENKFGELSALSVSLLGNVTGFAYLGKEEIETKNLSCVVNKHENLLNSAIYSYNRGEISSWIDFFKQDWAQIIFHDKFSELVKTLSDSIQNDKGVLTIIEKVFEAADSSPDDAEVALVRNKILGDRCACLPEITKRTIETHILEFLRVYKSTLPRYHVPQTSK